MMEGYVNINHNTGFGRFIDPGYVAHLVEHHKGTPALLIHAAVHSYRYAEPEDPWFGFTGVQSMWHEGQRPRSEEHTSELQSRGHLVCRLLLEKKKMIITTSY